MSKSQPQETPETHSEPENSNVDIHLEEPENSKDNNSEISSSKTNTKIQQQPSSSSSTLSSSEDSCSNTTATSSKSRDQIIWDSLLEVDDDIWSEVLWAPVDNNYLDLSLVEENYQINSSFNDSWFWDDLFTRSNELMLELPEL